MKRPRRIHSAEGETANPTIMSRNINKKSSRLKFLIEYSTSLDGAVTSINPSARLQTR